MSDQNKTKDELLSELEELRRRVAVLESMGRRDSTPDPCSASCTMSDEGQEERDRLQSILKATIDCLPFEFFAIGTDGRYILQNAILREHYGDALGKRPEDYAPDEATRQIWLDNNRRAFAGERVEGEVEAHIAGQSRRYHNIITPIRHGDAIYGILGVNIDITERKRAEEALQRSQHRYRTLLDTLPLVVYEYDVNGVITLANAASRTIGGYEPEEVVGTTLWDRMESDEEKRRAQAYLRHLVLEQPPPTPYFGRSHAKDGRQVDTQVDWNYLRDDQGEVVGFVCAAMDISERKRAEETLQEAHVELERRVEQRTAELVQANEALAIFRRFAETSSQGFSMADLDGRLLYLNPALCRILGEDKPDALIGQHLSICYSEETNRRGREEIEPALKQNGYWEGELPMLSRQGRSIPTWHCSFVIRDDQGDPLRLAVVITDMTERKKAEQSLRQSHDELKAIYDGMADGLHILSVATQRPVRVNPALCRMMGYPEHEILSLSPADVHPPEALPWILAGFQAVLEGRLSGITDVPLIRKDGSVFYADITGSRINYNNEPSMVCFFHDTTERRQAQETLERERRTLEHLFRSSDRERQLIAYDIHDGLAQYLAGAIMQFETFGHLKNAKPKEAGKAFKAGMTMLRQGHCEARRLINGVRPPILDEAGIVAAVSHLIHEQRQPSGPTIEFHATVKFDRLVAIQENAIYRVVQEGLTNACKYSQSERVWVEIVQEGEQVRIEVQDWGIGFAPDQIGEDCFGLAGIRERTRLLGGRSMIESNPGKGTRITVELPLAERKDYE